MNAITAGIAANKPNAVAINASEIPGATAFMVAWDASDSPKNAFTIPITVPNNPMYGLTEPTFARKKRCLLCSSASFESAMRIVAGTARNMGISIET